MPAVTLDPRLCYRLVAEALANDAALAAEPAPVFHESEPTPEPTARPPRYVRVLRMDLDPITHNIADNESAIARVVFAVNCYASEDVGDAFAARRLAGLAVAALHRRCFRDAGSTHQITLEAGTIASDPDRDEQRGYRVCGAVFTGIAERVSGYSMT